MDWTKEFSGWEVIANGVLGLVVTFLGVVGALAANAWQERYRARRWAIAEARELLDELMRLSLPNAPRPKDGREMVWPRASRTMEIITGLNVVESWLPSYFQGQVLILLEASSRRARKRRPKTTDDEREVHTGEIDALLIDLVSLNPARRRRARSDGEKLAREYGWVPR
jgi:hypothetical protein